MLDQDRIHKLFKMAEHQRKIAEDYAEQRALATKHRLDFEMLLIAELESIRFDKPNVGIEMANLMLMERVKEAKDVYKDWQMAEAKYKGLEKIIESGATELMFHQTVMNWSAKGEKY